MRPTKTAQSALRSPLNAILGTEANVRVLRELLLEGMPLARSEVARRSGLSLPGATGAMEKLQEAGIIEPVGSGGRPMAQLRTGHPLRAVLQALFHQEASRLPALLDDLRTLVGKLEPLPRAAWIEGSAAEGTDHPGEPLVLGFLAGARDVSRLATGMRDEIARIERDYDVTVEVRGRTEADIATLGAMEERLLRGAQGLLGFHPTAYLAQRGEDRTGKTPGLSASHAGHDYQAMLIAAWIAQRLDRDPSLPRRARSWLVHRLHDASDREAEDLNEWVRLLDTASIPRLQYILRDSGERSTRLRQSNPFVPVLTEAERCEMREEAER